MIRVLIVMLGLLSAWDRVGAAPWALPPGVKTLEVNGYPMAFLESGTGETVVLVHGSGADYRTWRRQVESPPGGFRLIAISLRHYYPERWDGKGDKFSEDQHVEDLGRFIETLAVGPVFLVAHSSGGRVAVKTAQKTIHVGKEAGLDGRPFQCVTAGVSVRRWRTADRGSSKSRQGAV